MNVEQAKSVLAEQKNSLLTRLPSDIIQRKTPDLARFISYSNVLAILGAGRCGKSNLASLLMIGKKFGYVNFDDERLYGVKAGELNILLQGIYELEGGDVGFLLFDEMQNAKGWEIFVSRLRDTKRIIITGSNSGLLSGDLATHLTGRHVDFALYPFSFGYMTSFHNRV